MKKYKRIVVKVGTKVLTSADRALDSARIEDISCQIAKVMDKGTEVILVTSGAIGAGLSLLNIKKRPSLLADLQAIAAIGQNHLMSLYGRFFKKEGYNVGQILLTQEDFNDRERYVNIKHTINTLLKHKAVPVINENDTVATEEIKCGDNDRLSSLVAGLSEAELLIMLSDVDGLLDEDGKVVSFVGEVNQKIQKLGGKSKSDLGTGGMATKLKAASVVTRSGADCVIANGREKNVIYRIAIEAESIGTAFKSQTVKLIARKRWIAFSTRAKGVISIDSGAEEALLKKKKSLLASGISGVEGVFEAGDVIKIINKENEEIARGVTNYSSKDLLKIKGLKSSCFKGVLENVCAEEAVHKDNLVII